MKQPFKVFMFVPLVIILLPSTVNALELQYYGIESHIEKDFTVSNTIRLIFNSSISEFKYKIPYNVKNLRVTSKDAELYCDPVVDEDRTILYCNLQKHYENLTQIKITFVTNNNIKRHKNWFEFVMRYYVQYPTKRLSSTIYLPQTASLSGEINESFSPVYGKTFTDGKRIIIYWEKQNLEEDDIMEYSINYVLPQLKEPINNFLISILTLFIVLVMIIIAFYIKKGGIAESTIKAIIPILTKDEKMVVEVLENHGGETGQKVIVRETDFSKAKVSRLINSLKERGVVRVEPLSGRENKVILLLKR